MATTNRAQQEAHDAAMKALVEFWNAHKAEYVADRKKEIEFGNKCHKVEKSLKKKAKEIGLHEIDVTPDGELLVVVDRHVRIV